MVNLVKLFAAVKSSHLPVFRMCIKLKEMKIQIAEDCADPCYFVLIWLGNDGFFFLLFNFRGGKRNYLLLI